MTRLLFFIFPIFLIVLLFPSCSIFTSQDLEDEEGSAQEEEYYEGDAGDAGAGKEEEEEFAEDESEEIVDEEDEEDVEEVADEKLEDEDGLLESDISEALKKDSTEEGDLAEEDDLVVYIDEEDEELISEGIVVEDTEDIKESEDDSDIGGIFDKAPSTPSVQAPSSTKKNISYKKIKSRTYKQAGFLVNAVYIARPGDTLQSVSNKIFNSNQQAQLQAINPHLKARSVKVGDKIYYSSPNRPNDSSRLLFFFEDIGAQASYYQAQAGENIRTLSYKLLRHANSWKEIWGTNPDVESKGALEQGFNLKYYAIGAEKVQQQPAAPEPEPELEPEVVAPTPPPSTDEPPAEGEIDESLPEQAETEPGDDDTAAPTPPPPTPGENGLEANEDAEEDKDTIGGFSINVIGGAIFALLACLFIIIVIKKSKKRDEFDFTATNIEI